MEILNANSATLRNRERIFEMLTEGYDMVQLEPDNVAKLIVFLLTKGFKRGDTFVGNYTFAFHFVKEGRGYALSGNWYEGLLRFYRELS